MGNGMAVAIVGMAGRFPGAADVESFWQHLIQGAEGIRAFTDEELLARGVPPALLSREHFIKAGAVLEQVDTFDASLFGYSPREAALMDPQHRIFLECAWEALERSGQWPDTERSTGVFAGTSMSTYLLFNLLTHRELIDAGDTFQVMIGNDKDFLATRVSYNLDLRGPSVNIQTGCSTSLVAVHHACQALLSYQCDVALAGGVSVDVPQRTGYIHEPRGIASPDGHCRPFDAQGQGTVFGSGVGVVVLKRLEDALASRDSIHAVILGTAINNDGSTKVGYTAPSPEGQAEVIARALAVAGVPARSIGYVEAHGTGTLLGDPVEVSALTRVFRAETADTGFCGLGSVKSNIGHLDAASGVAGLIKATLAVEHGALPPTLHFRQPNPNIDWERSPFVVNGSLTPWKKDQGPRRAGVSSFGIGGTNAHAVLEQAPPPPSTGPSRPWKVLPVSAHSGQALQALTHRLRTHLATHPGQDLSDVAYTLQVGRKALPYRQILVCREREEAHAVLESGDPERLLTRQSRAASRTVAFMFPGGGAQYVNMGRELYETEPSFRRHLETCASLLKRTGLSLLEALYPSGEASSRLTRPSVALPALFCLEYALAELWKEWGVVPEALMGHSMGEYTAACQAGILSLEDGLALVCERGRLFEQLPPGAMASVPLPEEAVRPFLGPRVSLAAINGAAQCALAGDEEAIEALLRQLQAQGIEGRRIHIDVAAHSHLVDPILPAFASFVSRLKLKPPTVPIVSCVTGTWMTPEEATRPDYWVRHLRQPVRFGQGVATLAELPCQILLEVGPGRTLSSLARLRMGHEADVTVLASLRGPREEGSDAQHLLTTLGRLWMEGVPVSWKHFSAHEQRRRVQLPTYPFERQRHWMEPRALAPSTPPPLERQPHAADWFYLPSWKRSLVRAPLPGPQRWLLVTDGQDLDSLLAKRLRRDGHSVTVAIAGSQAQRTAEDTYEVVPGSRASYAELLTLLEKAGRSPERIAFLRPLASCGPGPEGERKALEVAFHEPLALGQALAELPDSPPRHLVIVSSGVQAVGGHEPLHPEKAALLGICRVLPQELPHLTCKSVDVTPPTDEALLALLVEQLAQELTGPSSNATLAWRGVHRWEQSYESLSLPPPATPAPLRPQGTYLITGGLGGLGLVLAEHLARAVQARLVLVGRTPVPERQQWEALAALPGTDPLGSKLRKLLEFEALGARVLALSADTADATHMEEVLHRARAEFGELHGVIHAAGVPAGGLSQLRTREATEEILRPKVHGARVLDRLLNGTPLDFFLLCSSLTAVAGDFGQVDHCAANAFLDAFAQKRAAEGARHIMSLGWDTWREVGQAVTTALPAGLEHLREQMLAHALSPQEGVDVFGRALAHLQPHLVVSTRPLPSVLARSPSLLQELAGAGAPSPSTSPPPATLSSVDEVESLLGDIWRRLLGISHVHAHDNFFELGGNSLIGLKLVAEIKQRMGLEFPIVQLFKKPTLGGMARLLSPPSEEAAAPDSALIHRRGRGALRRERMQRKLDNS
ncbi:oxidoreductase, short chain dehydrogenase/reductase family [Stigmatella aurantiaca DW4/3-1]|nr:oxidoreductase, short chain dehydrogenase/reductase family [Stigmatella aurantiaca DW4/3-1]